MVAGLDCGLAWGKGKWLGGDWIPPARVPILGGQPRRRGGDWREEVGRAEEVGWVGGFGGGMGED